MEIKFDAIQAYQQTNSGKSTQVSKDSSKEGRVLMKTEAGTLVQGSPAAVYEKSDLITQLQNDAEARKTQLTDMVKNAISVQAGISVGDDDVWKFLASGNFTVTEAAKKQAQELISEDGYYGVEQTSERILQFAKALSGGDTSKAETLLNAFKKGYEQATGAWGKELPDICKQTYDKVIEKFNNWTNPEDK